MKLKPPAGTTRVRSATKSYALDSNGYIDVADDSPDFATFIAMGFYATAGAIVTPTPVTPISNDTSITDEGDDHAEL